MQFHELPETLQTLIKKNADKKYSDKLVNYYVLTQNKYDEIFWLMYRTQHRDENGKPISSNQATRFIHYLNEYITALSKQVPNSIKLRNPVLIRRPKPPLRHKYGNDLKLIERLDKTFKSEPDLCLSKPKTLSEQKSHEWDARFYLGQLIYSAMRFGGLLRLDLVNSYFHNLTQGKPFFKENLCWFELTGSSNDFHVWIPDPVTMNFLPRFYKHRNSNIDEISDFLKNTNWRLCLNAYLKNIGDTSLRKHRNKALVSLLIAKLSLTQTPCHLPVLDGTQPNLTLQRNSFYRLIGIHEKKVSNLAIEEMRTSSVTGPRISEDFKLPESAYTDCAEVMKQAKAELKKLLTVTQSERNNINEKKITFSEISSTLKVIASNSEYNLLPITRLLISWTATRLTSNSRWSNKLKPSSLLSFLGTIFSPMSRVFGAKQIHQLEPSSLDELYLEIIDEAPNLRGQLKRTRILRDFHIYLEKQYNLTPSYIFSGFITDTVKKTQMMVDANILMPTEYFDLLRFISEKATQDKVPTLKYAQIILLIIGFRCGLRRSEVYYLRISDIYPINENWNEKREIKITKRTEMLIRPFEQRTLKSSAAERRIPIGQLLNTSEIGFFNRYLEKNKITTHTTYLFTNPMTNSLFDQEELFNPLVSLLKQITGDDSFRYHRLRHSFNTWIFWYWQQHKYQYDFPLVSYLSHEYMKHLIDARKVYFQGKGEHEIRSELFAISLLTGHSGPSITILHYMHSFQWAYHAEFWKEQWFSPDTSAKLLDIPRRTYFDKLKKVGFHMTLLDAISEYCQRPEIAEHVKRELTFTTGKQTALAELELYEALLTYNEWYLFPFHLGKTSICPPPYEWAKKNSINEKKFENAVRLLNELQNKKWPGKYGASIRTETNLSTHNSFELEYGDDNVIYPYFTLRKSPIHNFAKATINFIIPHFLSLNNHDKESVLEACKRTLMFQTKDWASAQFWEADDLWLYLEQLYPLLVKIHTAYQFRCQIRARREHPTSSWHDLIDKWATPNKFKHFFSTKFTPYIDTGVDGYALFTVERLNHEELGHKVGDHGFFVSLALIYFSYAESNYPLPPNEII
ncbi:hypothetical protein LMJ53_15830 [Rheinheimera sp. UJ51]|uniref:hypothetical protein n=1 Tax=unclassified Rheinheimera TaxID=115860 RepID=UPI001E57FA75|nr:MULTISPECIES: hypothetical protein [unclassified Rheinheimera]MCC5453189.1 hypothetical protein [Rheinheimera sp. UJ51]MCF4010867.1 hypothetical protein [Rheinheimera sp. UJ63]